jgi:hypothetical protein
VVVVFTFDFATLRISKTKENAVVEYKYSNGKDSITHAAIGHDALMSRAILKRMLNKTYIA